MARTLELGRHLLKTCFGLKNPYLCISPMVQVGLSTNKTKQNKKLSTCHHVIGHAWNFFKVYVGIEFRHRHVQSDLDIQWVFSPARIGDH